MAIPPIYYAILEACNQPGCPVCRMVEHSNERYLDNLLYENVNDGELRNHLRHSLGFCNRHAWQLLEFGDVLGISIIYHDILGNVLKNLPEGALPDQEAGWLPSLLNKVPRSLASKQEIAVQALKPDARCPACEQEDRTVEIILSELTSALQNEELSAALSNSTGLCLPHLCQAFQHTRETGSFNQLLSISRNKIEGLHQELAEFIRKSDYRFRQEGLGSERDSGRRAIRIAVGERRVAPRE